MDRSNFPYADQNPFPAESDEAVGDPDHDSPIVHGLETPATRHVRENARLLIPGLGIFNREVWASLSRYAATTSALWLVFLLPMVTAILLPLMLIPDDVWNRGHPFTNDPVELESFLGEKPWLMLTPLAMFGLSSLLALSRVPTLTMTNSTIIFLQALAIWGMVVSAFAVLLVLGVWGYSRAVGTDFAGWQLGAVGAGSSGAALAMLKPLLSMPEGLRCRILGMVFTVFGYFVLGLALVAWHHVLWSGWDVLFISWEGFDNYDNEPIRHVEYWVFVGSVIVLILLSWVRTESLLNKFSMNRLYEERLQRTWIVSPISSSKADETKWGLPSRMISSLAAGLVGLTKRLLDTDSKDTEGLNKEYGWTRVWERSDMKLTTRIDGGPTPVTPYPLICTSLNLSGSTSPKLLNRRADSFVIGPVSTGSALTTWKNTSELHSFRSMPLARAAEISAAAFSPNMGSKTNRTLSIVTTLFNARLGWWARNPSSHNWFHRWFLPPSFLLYWAEMFGLASHNQPYIYLSDGGHFENLGIYELVRRRCKFIIAIDGTGEPPEEQPLNFDGLGVALRRVRIDFGVLVDMDLRPMLRDPETGHVKSYFAVGRIRYPSKNDGHGSGELNDPDSGILVYIKGGVKEDAISPDILNYHQSVNHNFPHDSTADQQFDEPQFESYRELGFLAGIAVCNSKSLDGNLSEWFKALYLRYQTISWVAGRSSFPR